MSVEGKLNAHHRNLCGHVIGGGGITRVKNYLANVDSTKSVKFCDKVHPEVKKKMRALLLGNVEKKKQKHILDARIRKTLNINVLIDDLDKEVDYDAQLQAAMKRSRQEAARTK